MKYNQLIKKMPTLQEIKAYTVPKLHTGKEWYIDFYAFNPSKGVSCRKKIKLNSIKSISERRKYAKDLIVKISCELAKGWNPWIVKENGTAYLTFKEVCEKYRTFAMKMCQDGNYRQETLKSYFSYLNNLICYNNDRKIPITYIYQFDKEFIIEVLDEIYLVRDNTAFTRDNYLGFIKSFANYCVNHNYLDHNPANGISSLGRRGKKKIRIVVDNGKLKTIHDYLEQNNRYYLLASYILYYCFIRPAEMSKLRIDAINIKNQTLFIEDTISKNRKDGTITLPKKIIKLMNKLNIFSYPSHYFLFSNNFKPGEIQRTEKMFRDYWRNHVRKDLKLTDKIKFYSLKDTGITNMLRSYDVVSVRDQARHSSILMTDIYTPHDIQQANNLIINYEGDF